MFVIQHKKEKDFKQYQDFRKYYPDAVIQKLVIIRNSVKKMREKFRNKITVIISRML